MNGYDDIADLDTSPEGGYAGFAVSPSGLLSDPDQLDPNFAPGSHGLLFAPLDPTVASGDGFGGLFAPSLTSTAAAPTPTGAPWWTGDLSGGGWPSMTNRLGPLRSPQTDPGQAAFPYPMSGDDGVARLPPAQQPPPPSTAQSTPPPDEPPASIGQAVSQSVRGDPNSAANQIPAPQSSGNTPSSAQIAYDKDALDRALSDLFNSSSLDDQPELISIPTAAAHLVAPRNIQTTVNLKVPDYVVGNGEDLEYLNNGYKYTNDSIETDLMPLVYGL